MAYRNYSTAVSHIVDATGQGDFTTIQAAINAAVAGQTIFIRPGTYTENITAKAGVNLDSFNSSATIIGKITLTDTGVFNISNISLQTNSDFILQVSGSNSSSVNFFNCTLNCTNNTGISLTSSNSGSQVNLFETTIFLRTTGIAGWTCTSPGGMVIAGCSAANPGSSTIISNNSNGAVSVKNSNIPFALGSTGTGSLLLDNCYIDCTPINTAALTANGTGGNVAFFNFIAGGTASAITVGMGAALSCAHNIVNSSNTNAITGLGTLNAGIITFTGSSSTINTSTVNKYTTYGGTII